MIYHLEHCSKFQVACPGQCQKTRMFWYCYFSFFSWIFVFTKFLTIIFLVTKLRLPCLPVLDDDKFKSSMNKATLINNFLIIKTNSSFNWKIANVVSYLIRFVYNLSNFRRKIKSPLLFWITTFENPISLLTHLKLILNIQNHIFCKKNLNGLKKIFTINFLNFHPITMNSYSTQG